MFQLFTFAQVNSSTSHHYKIGDNLYINFIVNFNIGDAGDNCSWDYHNMKILNNFTTEYTSDYERKGVITKIYGNTRFYYLQDSTSIKNVGYENNNIKVEYDKPQTVLLFPLEYGNKETGFFHGSCIYCESSFGRQFGTYSVEVDGKGMLILPNGKTLDKVYRVHSTTEICKIIYEDIHTQAKLKECIDSIRSFTNDSINEFISNSNNLSRHIETYEWYANGYRYPIIKVVVFGKGKKIGNKILAYYCAPEEQEKLYDTGNEEIRKIYNQEESRSNIREQKIRKCNESIPYDISTTENCVTITNNTSSEIHATITDLAGILYKSEHGMPKSSVSIDCTKLRHGNYIINIRIGEIISSEKIKL